MKRNFSLLLLLRFVFALLTVAGTRAAVFTGTNNPGQTTTYSFSVGSGVTNLSLSVSNSSAAFSHLLLRKGLPPDDDHFDFIAHFDGRDNSINLERPEFTTTNYFFAVRTPTNSETHEF